MNSEKLKGAMLMLDNFTDVLMFGRDKDGMVHGITKTEELQDLFRIIGNVVSGESDKHQVAAQVKYEAIIFAIWTGLSMNNPEVYRSDSMLKFFQECHKNDDFGIAEINKQ